MKISRKAVPPILVLIALASAVLLGIVMNWRKGVREPPPPAIEIRERIGTLAPAPDWSKLDRYQGTMSREAFDRALTEVFSAGDAWKGVVRLGDDFAAVDTQNAEPYQIVFGEAGEKPKRYWRSVDQLPACSDRENKPLAGVRIAIDPGHIGGDWAKIEERWYSLEEGVEVMEGTMTVYTARILTRLLQEMGAKVQMTRETTEPVSPLRPDDFKGFAAEYLRSIGVNPETPGNGIHQTVAWQSEKMFYRTQEIRTRSWLVNEVFQPDLLVCLHFNAEAWGDPSRPQFVANNHLHLLVNGTYSFSEMRLHDQCFEMLRRILQRTHDEELAVSTAVAASMAEATGLPPYRYSTPNAAQVGDSPYVSARNLLATRLYECPVVFLEPYVMNNSDVYERVKTGDYKGERVVAGKKRLSIYREYAKGVAEGLRAYYSEERR
jgi:hypothetical protein